MGQSRCEIGSAREIASSSSAWLGARAHSASRSEGTDLQGTSTATSCQGKQGMLGWREQSREARPVDVWAQT